MSYRVITATLKARTAVHVGSGNDSDLTDALLRRDATGQPFIPGTAVAGALRALLTRLAPRLGVGECAAIQDKEENRTQSCACGVCRMFGDVNPSDEDGAASTASRILVFNAHPVSPAPRPVIRDGVGIDRVTGAAARAGAVKFDLEVLPAGAAFGLRIELRNLAVEDEKLLAVGLSEWQAGRMWLGGRVARGLGAFDLCDVECKSLDLNQPENLMAFLKDDRPWQQAVAQKDWLEECLNSARDKLSAAGENGFVSQRWLLFTGMLQADGALLTNDALTAGLNGFDHAPLLAQLDGWQNPVLAGAGLRGVMRSHAERLARTLATRQQADEPGEFLRLCPACSPVESRAKEPLANCDALLKAAGVKSDAVVTDEQLCLACRLFGSTRRGSRLIVEDALFAGDKPVLKMMDFLAVDRFTGGGAEHLKFDALALWRPSFKFRFYLDNPASWELGWLWLVLRDFAEGWLSVGSGSARGFGRVTLKDWTAIFGFVLPEDAPEGISPQSHAQQSGIYTTVQLTEQSADWPKTAKVWVDAFLRQVESHNRPDQLVLKQDSYFGYVDDLYPVHNGGAQ